MLEKLHWDVPPGAGEGKPPLCCSNCSSLFHSAFGCIRMILLPQALRLPSSSCCSCFLSRRLFLTPVDLSRHVTPCSVRIWRTSCTTTRAGSSTCPSSRTPMWRWTWTKRTPYPRLPRTGDSCCTLLNDASLFSRVLNGLCLQLFCFKWCVGIFVKQ